MSDSGKDSGQAPWPLVADPTVVSPAAISICKTEFGHSVVYLTGCTTLIVYEDNRALTVLKLIAQAGNTLKRSSGAGGMWARDPRQREIAKKAVDGLSRFLQSRSKLVESPFPPRNQTWKQTFWTGTRKPNSYPYP